MFGCCFRGASKAFQVDLRGFATSEGGEGQQKEDAYEDILQGNRGNADIKNATFSQRKGQKMNKR